MDVMKIQELISVYVIPWAINISLALVIFLHWPYCN